MLRLAGSVAQRARTATSAYRAPTRIFSSSASSASAASSSSSAAVASKESDDATPLTETVRDFLEPEAFYNVLKDRSIDFYAGVPDSLLKDFCAYVTDTAPEANHVIAANEGAAVSVATGYHLATRKFPVVYMQNSGIGNAINPLLSLCDARIYSIPMLMMIGWRGEPGKRDEPQHNVQGAVMTSLLSDLGIKFEVLPDYLEGAEQAIESAVHHMETRSSPYVLLVKRQCFTKYKLKSIDPNNFTMSREQAIDAMLNNMGKFDVVVSTTGFASREVYELRNKRKEGHKRDFLTVGSMGHASAIAAGVALAKPSRNVYCIDGDGAVLMHMGNLATVGTRGISNLRHIVINNGAHDSVGGQPTLADKINMGQLADSVGYKTVIKATTEEELVAGMKKLATAPGPAFMEVMTNKGARADLGRPKESPKQNKEEFMNFLTH